uniref:Putative secreted peptide n=1 Tax=Anopheles braziliensis TaxID=58242 RepID=A0A2M3ZMU8_9DIPT
MFHSSFCFLFFVCLFCVSSFSLIPYRFTINRTEMGPSRLPISRIRFRFRICIVFAHSFSSSFSYPGALLHIDRICIFVVFMWFLRDLKE